MLRRMTPWLDALVDDVAGFRKRPIAQLATVTTDNRPAVRSVVLRGVTNDGAFWFSADGRSRKPALGPAELCLWLPSRSTQWRIAGQLELHAPGSERSDVTALLEAAWESMDAEARKQLVGPPPGSVRDTERLTPSEPAAMPDSLRVGLLTPETADRLVLDRPHRRTLFTLTGATWSASEVHP